MGKTNRVVNEVSEFGNILIFIIGGLLFILLGLLTSSFIRPNRPDEEKSTSYECGEDTIGDTWGNFNIRFYVIALMFLLFDVEIVFLFPWATVFGNINLIKATGGAWGWISILEAFVFVFILLLGLVYAWAKGYLEWVKPKMEPTVFKGNVPSELYDKINDKYSSK